MPPATFDTLATARNLKAAGIASAHAEAIVDTMRQAVGAHVATKADLDALRAKLKADVYRALWMQAAGIIGLTVALVKVLSTEGHPLPLLDDVLGYASLT